MRANAWIHIFDLRFAGVPLFENLIHSQGNIALLPTLAVRDHVAASAAADAIFRSRRPAVGARPVHVILAPICEPLLAPNALRETHNEPICEPAPDEFRLVFKHSAHTE